MNRSYYNANSILNKQRIPSLTPPKCTTANSLSKEKINQTKPVKDKPVVVTKKVDGYQPNTIFLQQQNAILSARKATLNLNDSSDKMRRTSPLEKSPLGPRIQALKQHIGTSLSQQTIQQQIDDRKTLYPPESESTQKSTLNSRELANNSTRKQDDYVKLQKEITLLQRKVQELEQKVFENQKKNTILENFNQQIIGLLKSCQCNRIRVQDVLNAVNDLNTVQHEWRKPTQDIQSSINTERVYTECSIEKIKRLSYDDVSSIKPLALFHVRHIIYQKKQQQSSKLDLVEDYFKYNQDIEQENKIIKQLISDTSTHIPSVVQALSMSMPQKF